MRKISLLVTKLIHYVKSPEGRYNLMVQLDFSLGLITAAFAGAQKWLYFAVSLALSLTVGSLTIRCYKRFSKSIVKEAFKDDRTNSAGGYF